MTIEEEEENMSIREVEVDTWLMKQEKVSYTKEKSSTSIELLKMFRFFCVFFYKIIMHQLVKITDAI